MGPLRNALLLAGLLLIGVARAATPFTVTDIRAEGLQRISAGTLFNYLPIKVGDRVDDARSAEGLKALYATGFFDDVRFERDGDVLVVVVDERPAVAEISFTGNVDIETEQLEEGLRGIGLAEGQVFNNSLLERIEQELTQLYFARGKYGVQIESTVTPLERNRVALEIDISEGQAAKIRQISIIGNEDFEEEDLVDLFQLSTPGWFTFFSGSDQYSKQKLAADIEALRSFYLDRGYLRFAINSTQVTISPDRRDVYITVNLTEGEPYTVSSVNLSGELVLPDDELTPLVLLRQGTIFSRRQATATGEALSQRLGDEGFAFANVNTVPEINDDAHTVDVTFFVDPGRRVYVRRINMRGNNSTRDEVLRREMRQMEGAWFATSKVNRSRARLQQLGYFEEVTVETPAVPGSPDEVDLEFQVKERPAGNFSVGVGFSQTQGVIFTGSVTQDNFFGTGSRVSLSVNTSQANTVVDYAYSNPYYTVDGISRGFRVFYRKTDANELNITNANVDSYGASMNFGIPLSEENRLRFDFEYKHTELTLGAFPRSDLVEFVAENGDSYDTLTIASSWSDDTRDRAIFPTRGGRQRIFGEISLPVDLSYYALGYNIAHYWPLAEALVFKADGKVDYGDGYGDTSQLPPFEKFFAGGLNCVRGWEENTLGPKDLATGDPLGGNLRVCGNTEFITPFTYGDITSIRLSAFFDIGNVFDTIDGDGFETDELRYSTGAAFYWLSPVGPLTFSYAFPLNDESGDEIQNFQFRIGGTF